MTPEQYKAKHLAALPYDAYLATGSAAQQANWRRNADRIALSSPQTQLLTGFVRRINALVLSGVWCGDCAQQGPALAAIARAQPLIDLRWLDRDQHPELAELAEVNGGRRVPVVFFLSEDYHLVGWFGDRTLSRYRALASQHLGPACPLPGAPLPHDEAAAMSQDWLDQFERVHLLLRLSTRLRQLHGD